MSSINSPTSAPLLPLHLIAAMANNRVIGKDGTLPWRIPEDLKFFKEATMGHAIIMGRKTFDEVGKPLPGRTNIVVSRKDAPTHLADAIAARKLIWLGTVQEAIDAARTIDPEPWVIGGAQIDADTLPFATHLHVTFIDRDIEGDTYFPPWDANTWVETESRTGAEPDVRFVTLRRR